MLDPWAPIGLGELEQWVIVTVLGSGLLALLLECRLHDFIYSLLPLRLLAHHMIPPQPIFLQEVAIASQDTSRSPLRAEAFGHHSWRGLGGRHASIIGVIKPGLEALHGPVLPSKAVNEEEGSLVSIISGRPYPKISLNEDGGSTERQPT
jgi:hypothetical protein